MTKQGNPFNPTLKAVPSALVGGSAFDVEWQRA
jgi:hypothetical protein